MLRNSRELVLADDEDGLVNLPAQDLRLNQGDGLAVDTEQTLALLGVGYGGGRLLLTEGRYGLRSRHSGE